MANLWQRFVIAAIFFLLWQIIFSISIHQEIKQAETRIEQGEKQALEKTFFASKGNVNITAEINNQPPCEVLVRNSAMWHLEVMESVAKQFPLHYLELPSDCDHENLLFDFSTKPFERADFFVQYINNHVLNSTSATTIDRSLGKPVKRTIRTALAKRLEGRYHAEIQVTCYCEYKRSKINEKLFWLHKWMKRSQYHMCIFHERCDRFLNFPRALWVSPHFPRHFIPTSLPQPVVSVNRTGRFKICSLGSSTRRHFRPLALFLKKNTQNSELLSKLTFFFLGGRGVLPGELKPFEKKANFQVDRPPDDWSFAAAAKTCDVILLLIKKDTQGAYFPSSANYTSLSKLSGSIPAIIAYRKSFIMPDEIIDLYKSYLPLDLPHAGYSDDETFVDSFSSLLTSLLGESIP